MKSQKTKMWKQVFISVISCVVLYSTSSLGITIDNQLVTARHDCFERIALGAMLPFEKTFRNSDTNSIKVCESLCAQEGDRCQTFALGIHIRGNGTCQLSSELIDATRARPVGTIFDPDFDLYARRNNCITEPDTPTFPSVLGPTTEKELFNRPSSSFPITTTVFSQETSTTIRNPNFQSSTPVDLDTPRPIFTDHSTEHLANSLGTTTMNNNDMTTSVRPMAMDPTRYPQPNDRNPSTDRSNQDRHPYPDQKPSRDKYPDRQNQPSSTRYPPKDQYPEIYPERRPNMARPQDDGYAPLDRPITYPLYEDRDRPISFLDYPRPYEKNYPMPNDKDRLPFNSYAQNIPATDFNYNRPPRPEFEYSSSSSDSDRNKHFYYNTYGGMTANAGERYGQSSLDNRFGSLGNGYDNMGNGYDNRPINNKYRPESPDSQNGYGPRPDNYGPRPDRPIGPTSQRPSSTTNQSNSNPSQTTFSSNQNSNRPDPSNNGYGVKPLPNKPSGGNQGGGGPGGNYHVTEEPIEIYFNPDSFHNTNKHKPGIAGSSESYGGGSPSRPGDDEACFRRVLAGKRVAPQWVRRTLACERVEDCQRECGEERRFTCEGFNYRLDPSGHGQGLCELIELPISEMNIYSSPHTRDFNLIRHPDYDYYERDRNASPGCSQPTGCVDCNYLKPYRPSYRPLPPPPPPSYTDYERDRDRFRPPSTTAVDKYRPPPSYDNRPFTYSGYQSSSSLSNDYHSSNHYTSSGGNFGLYNKPLGPELDRYDPHRPDYRPGYGEIQVNLAHAEYRPNQRPDSYGPSIGYRPSHNYLDRDSPSHQKQPEFVAYQIGQTQSWDYGNNQASHQKKGSDYWGIRNEVKRVDRPTDFNYFDLGKDRNHRPAENSIWSYPGSRYGNDNRDEDRNKVDYGSLWTRRPGDDDCSVKSSEGFRLHKGVIRNTYNAPNVRDCERMCASENKFKCNTYSFRYSSDRENCLLCDRPYNHLDYYADLEPDRDYDVYSMADDRKICNEPPKIDKANNAQCFFRAIDSNRFFKSIVRDAMTVRSVGECEMECLKATKFTCRAFSFRYGSVAPGEVIDNCQLSDWPVKDMDKERHLVSDSGFDVFERASYGHGCEIRPIIDSKHQKLCYLGYGSPAKLLSSAIKKVISVPAELDCKNECTRYRENTPFKCLSFSFGSRVSTFNCELSDLDQSELKLNIHYAHTTDRDYWLFAWNPFDWTCRDKVTTIGGGSRVNNDRRMDIFRDPGEPTWRHFTVSGKACRIGSQCERNQISGFYSCELEGTEITAWDYCCRDDHPCGYSQGFDYPWCYVGDEKDQWRTCSERYFPVKKEYLMSSGSDKSTSTTKLPDRRKDNIYQSPPRPGGFHKSFEDIGAARLWPVTFLYFEGPPNSTELSNVIDCKRENC